MYKWNSERRFNAYSNYNRLKYGKRIQKVSLDAGFTCPNRDGTVAFGGCTYCNNDSFNPSYCDPSKPILQQIDDGIEFLARRYKSASDKFLISPELSLTAGSTLEFWHKYDFEAGYDGAIIEITSNNGVSWSDLGSDITIGGYDTVLNGGFGQPLGAVSAWNGYRHWDYHNEP